MKAASFRYYAATSVDEAVSQLAAGIDRCVLVAGGQSLVPALALRRLQPSQLIDITGIDDLRTAGIAGSSLVLGACITARMIEDGLVPDLTRGILPRIAACVGPRAVRCRGTIGGNLALADPVSDWIVALSALGASLVISGPRGSRSLAVSDAGQSGAIAPDELLASVRVPEIGAGVAFGAWALRLTSGARPEVAAAVLQGPHAGNIRCAVGVAGGELVLLEHRHAPDDYLAAIASGVPPAIDATLALFGKRSRAMRAERIRLMATAIGCATAAAIRV
jgi:aerobic carbon-monoxide dehydrogenase medium subunit